MKKAILTLLALSVCTNCFAGEEVFFSGPVSSDLVISTEQPVPSEMLVGALVQIAWTYTYKERFDTFAKSMVENVVGSNISTQGSSEKALSFEVESDLQNTTLNLVYRF